LKVRANTVRRTQKAIIRHPRSLLRSEIESS
jgi:hypothetical protein